MNTQNVMSYMPHDLFLTPGMTGSFGGFMPGSMGGGSPFGSMQVSVRKNYVRKRHRLYIYAILQYKSII